MKSKAQMINERLDDLEQLVKQYRIKDDDLRRELQKRAWFQKAVDKRAHKAVNDGCATQVQQFVDDNIYAVLAALVVTFKFGKTNLERFMSGYESMYQELKEYYECGKEEMPSNCQRIVESNTKFRLKEWNEK